MSLTMNLTSRLRRAVAPAALLTALAMPAVAQDFERIAPKEPPANPPAGSLPAPPVPAPTPGGGTVLLPALKGVVFLPDAGQLRRDGVASAGIDSGRVDVLDRDDFRALLAPFLGQPVTLDRLNEISRLAVVYFREHDHPLVDIVIPEQDVSAGTVQILALEFRAGTVRTEGNRWFSDGLLLSQVRTRPGDRILASDLLADVNWLNRNPFRRVDLVYERSEQAGRSDIGLRVADRLPLRAFGGYENTGTASTERGRSFVGVNWGNAFWLDHQLSYQFTASPGAWRDGLKGLERARSASHSGSYFAPLPWRHTLTVFGSYSETRPDLEDSFTQLGRSSQASVRYGVPLPALWGLEHEVQGGFDWKRTNSDLAFGGTSVARSAADVAQWMLGYSAVRPDAWGSTAAGLSLFVSPGGFDDKNSSTAFQLQRSGAEARYHYGRLTLERLTRLPEGLSWSVRVQGQMADRPLLATEQLGFGGGTSVRGYDERVVNGDQGVLISNELRSPEFGVLGQEDAAQVLAFWDYGAAWNRNAGNGVPRSARLSGAGVGLRYALAPYLSLRFDYGWALTKAPGEDKRGTRPHIGLTAAF
ncbi:ShlB/FhaC/HecB family hemolysin secretion/activation protein [Azospirillum sp.]|uniref:ShlB/FhaC/HecB family hemolysin secretion/activation protein n=1 Tax=Azospirillum sp. TaxID=34012 RepID=UPI003D754995